MAYGLGIDTSIVNILWLIGFAVMLNLTMCAQGYWCGSLTDDEFTAQPINTTIILIFMLTSGGLGNADSFPPFIRYVSYLSP